MKKIKMVIYLYYTVTRDAAQLVITYTIGNLTVLIKPILNPFLRPRKYYETKHLVWPVPRASKPHYPHPHLTHPEQGQPLICWYKLCAMHTLLYKPLGWGIPGAGCLGVDPHWWTPPPPPVAPSPSVAPSPAVAHPLPVAVMSAHTSELCGCCKYRSGRHKL